MKKLEQMLDVRENTIILQYYKINYYEIIRFNI